MPGKVFKISLLGAALSGRTELLRALAESYSVSVHNLAFNLLTVRLDSNDDQPFCLEIGRLGLLGATIADSLTEARRMNPDVIHQEDYLRESKLFLFVFDGQEILWSSNIQALRRWQSMVTEAGIRWDWSRVIVVVNKIDLPNYVSSIQRVVKACDVPMRRIVEVSAKTGAGVGELHGRIVNLLS